LSENPYEWEIGQSYEITVKASASTLTVLLDGQKMFCYTDTDNLYIQRAVGFSVREGSRLSSGGLKIHGNRADTPAAEFIIAFQLLLCYSGLPIYNML